MIFQTVNCVTKKKKKTCINLEAQFKANKTLSALYIHSKKKSGLLQLYLVKQIKSQNFK